MEFKGLKLAAGTVAVICEHSGLATVKDAFGASSCASADCKCKRETEEGDRIIREWVEKNGGWDAYFAKEK